MQKRHLRETAARVSLAAALMGALFFASACENNADTDPGDGLPPNMDFYLTPSTAELMVGAGNEVMFTVVGGEPPFLWAVEQDTLGSIQAQSERSALYERKPLIRGVNTVTVRDASVLKARATVIQD